MYNVEYNLAAESAKSSAKYTCKNYHIQQIQGYPAFLCPFSFSSQWALSGTPPILS